MASAARNVYIVAAKRTPFGTFGGKLRDFSATQMSAIASRATLAVCAEACLTDLSAGPPSDHLIVLSRKPRLTRPMSRLSASAMLFSLPRMRLIWLAMVWQVDNILIKPWL
jgi:hypothetical protein